MDLISPADFKLLLTQYRKDVPSVGTVEHEAVDKLLAEQRICRGWTKGGDKKQFFHIIKSPGNYPELSAMFADSEKDLLVATVFLGMQASIDLADLFCP